MKRINLLLISTILLTIALIPLSVSAAGEAYVGYYDFDDYTAEVLNRNPNLPEGFISATDYGWGECYIGSADCSGEGRGRVLSLRSGEATLLFDKKLMDGKLHISYDAKVTTDDLSLLTCFWSDSGKTGTINQSNNYYKAFFINKNDKNTLKYYGNMIDWDIKTYDGSFTSTEWHRFDLVASGITETGSKVSLYCDGALMYSDNTFMGSNGIFGVSFRVGSVDPENPAATTERAYIDNLNVRHYYNETGLAANSTNGERISKESSRISIRLSEPVEPTLLTTENVLLSGGSNTPDYTIENASATSFDIVFDGEIPYGRYKINFSSAIVGGVTRTSLRTPLDIMTEERWLEVTPYYDFNSYQGDGVLPNFFVTENGNENSYANAELISEGDYALSFKGFENTSRNPVSMFIPLEVTPELGNEFSVEFDIKSKDMRWYLYLAEDGDITEEEITKNAAIGMDENGVVKYAKGYSSTATFNIANDTVTLTEDEWHTIKLTVVPDTSQRSAVYKLSLDDGDVYTLETTREFYDTVTEGIGFGYIVRAVDAEMSIDNIRVYTGTMVKYPEVESITLYDYNGNVVKTGKTLTTMIKSAEIKYNTHIAGDFYNYIKLFVDDERTDFNYDFIKNEDDTDTVIMRFDNMLLPLTKYEIVADVGLSSKYLDTAQTYVDERVLFYTLTDTGYSISTPEYDVESKTATVEFAKNNSDSGSYVFAVCAYKNIDIETEDGTKMVKKLINMKFIPIDISEKDLGVMTYTLTLDASSADADEVAMYLWNYPELSDVDGL